MASYRTYWIEDMPTPWDMDCRGKFCIHQIAIDLDNYEFRGMDGKFNAFRLIKEELMDSGKLEFLANNGIDFYKSARFTAIHNTHLHQAKLAVLVDMPHNVRTLYKLTFTE